MAACTVIVYTQQHCASCNHIKEFLEARCDNVIVKDISTEPRALHEFMKLGYYTTPLTIIDGVPVAGFDRKRFERLLSSRVTLSARSVTRMG